MSIHDANAWARPGCSTRWPSCQKTPSRSRTMVVSREKGQGGAPGGGSATGAPRLAELLQFLTACQQAIEESAQLLVAGAGVGASELDELATELAVEEKVGQEVRLAR